MCSPHWSPRPTPTSNELRQATILEVQRSRTVIDFAGRHVYAPVYEFGDWAIPRGSSILVSIARLHTNPDAFPDPDRFDPQRFVGAKPPSFAWIPFGGGARRCVGAVFANMEMDVVLRTVLRHFTIETTTAARGEVPFPGRCLHPEGRREDRRPSALRTSGRLRPVAAASSPAG